MRTAVSSFSIQDVSSSCSFQRLMGAESRHGPFFTRWEAAQTHARHRADRCPGLGSRGKNDSPGRRQHTPVVRRLHMPERTGFSVIALWPLLFALKHRVPPRGARDGEGTLSCLCSPNSCLQVGVPFCTLRDWYLWTASLQRPLLSCF